MRKGHATHFLERLERLEPADLELALGLYRDAPLVKSVLLKASLPSGDGRVAISIGREGQGPWLVVERDGAFVTCLAAGMKHDLPMVQRDQLDAISTMESKLRACIKASRDLTGADRPSARFITDTLRSGRWMSRERFLAIQALGPLMLDAYLDAAHKTHLHLHEVSNRLLKVESFGPRHAASLSEREQLTWRMTHLLMASADGMPSVIEGAGPKGAYFVWLVCSDLLNSGYVGPTFRGLWLAARLGPWLMSPLMKADEAPESMVDVLYAPTALAAIGVRHLEHRGEVLKRLKRTPEWMKDNLDDPITRDVIQMRQRLVDMLVDERHPDREPVAGRAFMRARGVSVEQAGPELFHLFAVSHLPNDKPVYPAFDTAEMVAQSCGWVATTPGADLNLPDMIASGMQDIETPFDDHVRAESAARALRSFEVQEPLPAHGEGRNARCACGSGKKRKRCCGAQAS